jgi:hypothetical protein
VHDVDDSGGSFGFHVRVGKALDHLDLFGLVWNRSKLNNHSIITCNDLNIENSN